MDSITEIERRVIKKPKKAKPEDLDILARRDWDLATGTDDFREERRQLKRPSYSVGFAFAAGADAGKQLEP